MDMFLLDRWGEYLKLVVWGSFFEGIFEFVYKFCFYVVAYYGSNSYTALCVVKV